AGHFRLTTEIKNVIELLTSSYAPCLVATSMDPYFSSDSYWPQGWQHDYHLLGCVVPANYLDTPCPVSTGKECKHTPLEPIVRGVDAVNVEFLVVINSGDFTN